MAKIYYRLIIDPDIDFSIDNVPSRWKEEVEQLLEVSAVSLDDN